MIWGISIRPNDAIPLLASDAAALEQCLYARTRIVADTLQRLPFATLGNAHRFAPGGHLRRVHQTRVIVLVAGERQPLSLDRPGDEQGGNVVLRRVERFNERLHAMTAKVGEQGGEGCVVIGLEERRRGSAYLCLDA